MSNASTTLCLFDGAALHPHERATLWSTGQAFALYDDLDDPQASDSGPIWSWHTSHADAIKVAVWAEPHRAWAAAELHLAPSSSPADEQQDRIARHFRLLRYVHTHDGQRYFFRFADARCLLAMHAVLNPAQRSRLFGPVLCWAFIGRDAHLQALSPDEHPAPAVPNLHLHAKQLSALLDLTWPDQLLASAIEMHPDIESTIAPVQRHAIATRVCAMLQREAIERYPVQLAALIAALQTSFENASMFFHPEFISAIKRSEATGTADDSRALLHWMEPPAQAFTPASTTSEPH